MSPQFIHPNWHVLLIHYPIALLTLGLLVELCTLIHRRGTLRAAGRWMLLMGALSSLPAATAGIHAYYQTVRYAALTESASAETMPAAWYHLVRDAQNHLISQQWADLKHHIWRAASGTIIVNIAVLLYLAASDRWRRRLYFLCLALVLFATIVLMSGAWYAGESVYVRGTALQPDARGVVLDPDHLDRAVEGIVPPIQLHVVLAGLTVAMALAALAMSIRAMAMMQVPPAAKSRAPSPGECHDSAYADSPVLQREMTVLAIRPPRFAVRFWLLAMLLAMGTAAAGVWVAGWNWGQFKPLLAQPRDLVHIILGVMLVSLTVILAIVTRWAARRRWLLATLASLLLLVIIGQLWMGILLMYDGSDGGSSLYQFQRPIVQTPG